MKKFLALVLIGSLISFASSAQTFLNRNGDERFAHSYTTTDSAYHYIDSLVMQSTEAGIFEVSVVGLSSDGYAVTGVLKARYINHAGTLTVGSTVNTQTPVTDTQLGTATFDITTSSNKCYIRLKGKDGKTITWYSVIKRKSISL
jgi:hypothetical protein